MCGCVIHNDVSTFSSDIYVPQDMGSMVRFRDLKIGDSYTGFMGKKTVCMKIALLEGGLGDINSVVVNSLCTKPSDPLVGYSLLERLSNIVTKVEPVVDLRYRVFEGT